VDLSRLEIKIHATQGPHASEGFGDVPEGEQRGGVSRHGGAKRETSPEN
jgi:hypothetical protein